MAKWTAFLGVIIMFPLINQALKCYQCYTVGKPEAEAQECRDGDVKFVKTCAFDETCKKTIRYPNKTGTDEEDIVKSCSWLGGHPAIDECRRPWGDKWRPVDPTKKMNINCACQTDLCNKAAHLKYPTLFLLVIVQYIMKA